MADFDYAGALFSGKPQGAPADQQVDYASQLFSGVDRKSTRLNSSHSQQSRMPSSA